MPSKILIVDDDADLRATLAAHFELEGFVVHEAADGVGALGEALAEVPDVVLLDLNLPLMSGPHVLRLMRANARTAEVPVVLLSARLNENSGSLTGLRFEAAMPKPCALAALTRTIRSLLKVA